ncbi:hypothetical protein FB451DRAFT_1413644 [Mycena latifolia]|nr:hypothetical protein FB451DRAFT_1413644 [Mycena latifolia]
MSSTDYLELPSPEILDCIFRRVECLKRVVPHPTITLHVLEHAASAPPPSFDYFRRSESGATPAAPRTSFNNLFGVPPSGIHHHLVNASRAPPSSFNYIFQRPASRATRSTPCTTFNSIFGVPARHLEASSFTLYASNDRAEHPCASAVRSAAPSNSILQERGYTLNASSSNIFGVPASRVASRRCLRSTRILRAPAARSADPELPLHFRHPVSGLHLLRGAQVSITIWGSGERSRGESACHASDFIPHASHAPPSFKLYSLVPRERRCMLNTAHKFQQYIWCSGEQGYGELNRRICNASHASNDRIGPHRPQKISIIFSGVPRASVQRRVLSMPAAAHHPRTP